MEVCLLVVSVLVGFLTLSEGCSPPIGGAVIPTLEQKVDGSDAVVHGVVLSTQRDTRYHVNAISDVYSVKFEVRCVYKGEPVDRIIQIDEVGHIPGHCITTNLTVGLVYLVYLQRIGQSRYTPNYLEDPGSEGYLQEIIGCDTHISYPTGLSEKTTNYKCPDPLTEAECEPKIDATDNVPADSKNPGINENTTNNKWPNVITTNNVPTNPENPDTVTPEKSVVAGPSKEDNDKNASTALTWHIITLLVSSIFLL